MSDIWFDDLPEREQLFFAAAGKTGNQNLFGIDIVLQEIIGASGDPFGYPGKIFCTVQFFNDGRAEFIRNRSLF